MTALKYTSVAEINEIHSTLRKTFNAGTTRPLAYRRQQLLQLGRLVRDNADAFKAALKADLNKPDMEASMHELLPAIGSTLLALRSLESWAANDAVEPHQPFQKGWSPRVLKTPKGVVLIIAPWNFPVTLTLNPLVGAIAAGCPAVVKPSELTPATSGLLAELFPKYLDPAAYRVVNGAVEETTEALKLQWDHIFYTGNGRVARIVAQAAAQHLTPLTLELGGKSPVYVDASTDIKVAAKRVLHGKILNAGQICVAPDYVLTAREKQDEFVAALKEANAEFFPRAALDAAGDYPRIVTPAHLARLTGLLKRTAGEVVLGGEANEERLEPTVVKNVRDGDALLEEEIFGPILPIVPVDGLDDAIAFINARPHALSLYVFSNDPSVRQQFEQRTTSGSLSFNDTFTQIAVSALPMGGVGASGYGNQTGKYTFDGFTHLRSSIDLPLQAEPALGARYRPYSQKGLMMMMGPAFPPIPDA